ncbi:MAG: thiamine phosphate synthase [Myxococcales bacterium]|nr:thiamine phosphate synthase [Myxococcales bacterium]
MTSSDALFGAPLLESPQRSARSLSSRVLVITDGMGVPGEPAWSLSTGSAAVQSDAGLATAAAMASPTTLEALLACVLSAVPAGALALQLRNRTLPTAALLERARSLRALTWRYGAPLLINDRLDVALAVEADGVHLPGQGLPPQIVRRWLGERLLICAAAHSLAEARLLAQAGADAVTLSPIWPTPSKPELPIEKGGVQPLGLHVLAQAARSLPVPVFALGGIDRVERVAACAAAGARVACIRALLSPSSDAAGLRAAAFVAAATAASLQG